MAKIFLRYNFSSVAERVICAVFAHSNPSAELSDKRWVLDNVTPGLEKNGTHVVEGIKPEMHTVRFYASSDGVTLETDLDCSVAIDASTYNEAIIQRYEYVVGRGLSDTDPDTSELIWKDPEDGDTELNDTRLAGVTSEDGEVSLQGFGELQSGQITWLATGGFSWADGKTFGEDERYIVKRIFLVGQQAQDAEFRSDLILRPLVDADFTGGVVNFGPDFYGRRCPVKYSGQFCKMVFGSFALIPDTVLEINTYQGNQIYFQLQFFTGNTVAFNGANQNVIDFPKMEWCRLEWKSGVCYVTGYNGRAHMRGQIIGDTQDRSISNAGPYLSCAEAGSPADGNIYTGLYKWITELPADRVIDLSLWGASTENKLKWGLNTANKTFRPPAVEGMHRRFRTGSEPAGTYVPDAVKEHDHFTIIDDFVSSGTSPISGTKKLTKSNETNGNLSYRLQGKDAVATLGPTSKTGGSENTVKAYKEIPLVVL